MDASGVKIDDLILEAQLINSSFSLQKGVQYSIAASQLQNMIATTVHLSTRKGCLVLKKYLHSIRHIESSDKELNA